MNEKTQAIKDAIVFLEKINTHIIKEYESLFNYGFTPKQLLLLMTVRDSRRITVNHSMKLSFFEALQLNSIRLWRQEKT